MKHLSNKFSGRIFFNSQLSILNFLIFFFIFLSLSSCEDDDNNTQPIVDPDLKGIFILNEGNYGKNDASLSFYVNDEKTIFSNITEGYLGETGQDIIKYGDKIYITVSGSGYISVISAATKQEVKKIEIKKDGISREPQYMTTAKGKIYVTTCSDGYVLQIDTTSLQITKEMKVGNNPEGICYSQGKLYIANSGWNFPIKDNTVSIVSEDLTQEEKWEVDQNPYYIQALSNGELILSCRDVYDNTSFQKVKDGALYRLNLQDKSITEIVNNEVLKFAIDGNNCYYFTSSRKLKVYNTQDGTINDFITDNTTIPAGSTYYGIGIHPQNKNVFVAITDYINPGDIYVFDNQGNKIEIFDSKGINPNGFAFYY